MFAWVPSIAPTQVIEISNFNSRWDGDLLVGTLKASSVYRLRLEEGRVIYSERIWIGERIRDIAQTNDGTIVLWTDDSKLLFVTVDKDQLALKWRTRDVISNVILNDKCLGCHHFGPTDPTQFAPSLSNLLNRPIASDTFSYSPALRAKQHLGKWTPALLTEFLTDPFKFASGTNMLPLNLSPADVKDIVDNLVGASQFLLAEAVDQRGVKLTDSDEFRRLRLTAGLFGRLPDTVTARPIPLRRYPTILSFVKIGR